jgi:hypothetical protein
MRAEKCHTGRSRFLLTSHIGRLALFILTFGNKSGENAMSMVCPLQQSQCLRLALELFLIDLGVSMYGLGVEYIISLVVSSFQIYGGDVQAA